jgi:ATP/maltotriose-dependent transcriptional regulator MalT
MNELEDQEVQGARSHIIERPRLTRLLDEATAPVIMLIAPAGYGKTTLARQWLVTRDHIWCQASSASSDVAALALGIAEAVEPTFPGAGRRLREWLPTSREPGDEVHVIAALLEDDVADWQPDTWFVVDDYHLLSSTASEDLIQKLFLEKGRRVFLTSRRQPAWSSAREVLYGNYFELGQSSLAMTVEEANDTLTATDNEAAKGLVALANGWPAVIGLAAMTPTEVGVENELPRTLHDYLAEELFSSMPTRARTALCRLALLPNIDQDAARRLVGPSADDVLRAAVSAGVLTAHGPRERRFHPLLRLFLQRRLEDLPPEEVASAATDATRTLIANEAWNDAFSPIERFARADLLDELLSAALRPLVAQGRLATIRAWLEFGRSNTLESPYLDLADAELAFRAGDYDRAETLAGSAAISMPSNEPLRSACYYRAGQSRDLIDDGTASLKHFEDAYETALTSSDAQNALWGQFVAAVHLEHPDAGRLLQSFVSHGPQNHDASVRKASGRLILAIRDGGLREAISGATTATQIIDRVADPLIRSVFWYSLATAEAFAGSYEMALGSIGRALDETRAFHLEFAAPHMLICQATAQIGLREFRSATTTISRIEEWAKGKRDAFLTEKTRALRCRLLLTQGACQQALDVSAHPASDRLPRGLRAELGALNAAAHAAGRDPQTALELSDVAQNMSVWVWPQKLLGWTRVICSSILRASDVGEQARHEYSQATKSGVLDPFVLASRLHPELLELLARDAQLHHDLAENLSKTNDVQRARALGIPVNQTELQEPISNLTKRELEVYELLAQGRSNREIGSALFISEFTAKTHVAHILRKLGVRTRTEAALQAVRKDEGSSRAR